MASTVSASSHSHEPQKKTGMLELLAVTDAAVKALDKSTQSHSSASSQSSKGSKAQIKLMKENPVSPDSGISKTCTLTAEEKSKKITSQNGHGDHFVQDRSSDESTTASDVLIRSTLADPDEKSFLGVSLVPDASGSSSKCSKSSFGIDNFNSSGPQKVKISTKHLREIRSPLETTPRENYEDKTVPPALCEVSSNSHNQGKLINGMKDHVDIEMQRHLNSKDVLIKTQFKPAEVSQSPHEQTEIPKDQHTPPREKPAVHVQSTPKYTVERHTPKKTYPKPTTGIRHGEGAEKDTNNSDLDLIPQREGEHDGSSSCSSQPEIITVPENIVTVSARTSVSTDSPGSEMGDTDGTADQEVWKPPARFQMFSKVSGVALRQGAPVEGPDAPDKKKCQGEVQICKFGLTERQKLVKDSFAKRYEQAGPVRRVVQPKLIGHCDRGIPTSQTGEGQMQQPNNQSTDILTAAVAASAAVAATQPFLKAQHELESKMAQILDKLAGQEGKQDGGDPDEKSNRVLELQKQLTDVTEKRLEHLEKVQEQQLEMQAKLLGMSREPPESKRRPQRSPSRSPPPQRRQDVYISRDPPKRAAFSKTTLHEPAKDRRVSGEHVDRLQRYNTEVEDMRSSPLDTPAPRSRAPKPVAYGTSDIDLKSYSPTRQQKRDRGILEEILATAGSPVRDDSRSQPAQSSFTKKHDSEELSSTRLAVKKAEDLVEELSNIKQQMTGLIQDAEEKRKNVRNLKQIQNEELTAETLLGPSPLDPYLVRPETTNASPYKSIPDLSASRFNAPLPPGFSDAKNVLQQVKKNRNILESNLDTVLRSRQDAEVYSLLETLYHDRNNAEKTHIQTVVDKCIDALRTDVEREAREEMDRLDTRKRLEMIAAKSSQPATTAGRGRGRGRGQLEARIDTGIRRGKVPPPSVPQTRPGQEKDNLPGKPKPGGKKPRKAYENEDYMTRVYGKAAYQQKRTTVKDPYLHFQSVTKPKPASTRPPPVSTIKATEVKSSKTQTSPGIRQFYFNPASGTYIPVTSASSAPIPGQLIPMAVPLGGPRMDAGVTVPITMTTASGSRKSTPVAKTQVTASGNTAIVSIGIEENMEDEQGPELTKQVLPSVDIDSEVGSQASPGGRAVHLESPQRSPVRFDVMYHREVEEEEEGSDYSDEDVRPESAQGLAFPGYQGKPPEQYNGPAFAPLGQPPEQYNGPAFPPQGIIPPAELRGPTSDTIADDIRRRDLLQNKATEWIEQELMARIISEVYPLKRDEPAEIGPAVSEISEDSIVEDPNRSMFVMDAIGRVGLQLFVDTGCPVDNELVNQLIKEVMEEKIATMLGQRPEEDVVSAPRIVTVPPASAVVLEPRVEAAEEQPRPKPRTSGHVGTPQPTPKSSPVPSPTRVTSPPLTPPLSPVMGVRQNVRAPASMEPVGPQYESEPESASLDISEELQRLRGKLVTAEESMMAVAQTHQVETPRSSPEPEPEPPVVEHRTLSPPLPSPRVVKVSPPKVIKPPVVPVSEPSEAEQPSSPTEEPPSPPPSPQPWGDPDSPCPEENPDFEEFVLDEFRRQPKPIVFSVAPMDDLHAGESMEFVRRSPSPVRRQPTPSPTGSESDSVPSSITDTVNESISEGQWVVNRSEGELGPVVVDDAFRAKLQHVYRQRVDMSTASTWRDTDDIELDETTDVSRSEGEYMYRGGAMDNDPVLGLLMKLQKHPMRFAQTDMTANEVQNVLNATGRSTGEVNGYGMARQNGRARNLGAMGRSFGEVSMGEIDPYMEQQRRSPTHRSFDTDDSPMKSADLRSSPSKGRQVTVVPQERSPPSHTPQERSVSPTRASPERTTSPTRAPQVRQMVTVTPGGRTSPSKSSMRKPPQMARSSAEPSQSARFIQVRSSSELQEQEMEGAATMSDQGTRTFTPDQMNVDALIQSGYLSQTFSQSEDGRHTDLGRQGGLTRTLSEGGESGPQFQARSPDRHGKALGNTYSFDSEADTMSQSELRRLAGSGILKMSLTIPTTGDSDEESEVSEIE